MYAFLKYTLKKLFFRGWSLFYVIFTIIRGMKPPEKGQRLIFLVKIYTLLAPYNKQFKISQIFLLTVH